MAPKTSTHRAAQDDKHYIWRLQRPGHHWLFREARRGSEADGSPFRGGRRHGFEGEMAGVGWAPSQSGQTSRIMGTLTAITIASSGRPSRQ
jgi:hypothetical protein